MAISPVEKRLWQIFAYYSLRSEVRHPELLNAQQFLRLAQDAGILDNNILVSADVHITFQAARMYKPKPGSAVHQFLSSIQEHNQRARQPHMMPYTRFLNALVMLSKKVFPQVVTGETAFERLLAEHILPNAKSLKSVSVGHVLTSTEVLTLFDTFEKPLLEIFQFYATAPSPISHEQSFLGDESASQVYRNMNSMAESIAYKDFMKFCKDFNLTSNVLLSTVVSAENFLSSMQMHRPSGVLRKLRFVEFWECLVRCALSAYKTYDVPQHDKVKGLMLHMWRALQEEVPRAIAIRRDVSLYSGNLLAGAMHFNNRFTAQWQVDGYRDYLSPMVEAEKSGEVLLRNLLTSPAINQHLIDSLNEEEAVGAWSEWDEEQIGSKRDIITVKNTEANASAIDMKVPISDDEGSKSDVGSAGSKGTLDKREHEEEHKGSLLKERRVSFKEDKPSLVECIGEESKSNNAGL